MRAVSLNAPKLLLLALIGILTGLTACVSDQPTVYSEPPGGNRSVMGAPPVDDRLTFKPGDSIKVEFSESDLEKIETEVKHDGSVSLKYVDRIVVTNKTPREVESEIKKLYVPRYYRTLSVTVTPGMRFFIVGGEVKSAGRITYSGKITLVGAIQAAGGFGTFADRKRVQVTRSSGEVKVINYNDVLKNPALDIEILPGDKINVPETII